jgi:hypothetical protein
MSKRDLLNKINEIVIEMSNVLATPQALPIAKEYARSNGLKQIEELILSYIPEEKEIDNTTEKSQTKTKKK